MFVIFVSLFSTELISRHRIYLVMCLVSSCFQEWKCQCYHFCCCCSKLILVLSIFSPHFLCRKLLKPLAHFVRISSIKTRLSSTNPLTVSMLGKRMNVYDRALCLSGLPSLPQEVMWLSPPRPWRAVQAGVSPYRVY